MGEKDVIAGAEITAEMKKVTQNTLRSAVFLHSRNCWQLPPGLETSFTGRNLCQLLQKEIKGHKRGWRSSPSAPAVGIADTPTMPAPLSCRLPSSLDFRLRVLTTLHCKQFRFAHSVSIMLTPGCPPLLTEFAAQTLLLRSFVCRYSCKLLRW